LLTLVKETQTLAEIVNQLKIKVCGLRHAQNMAEIGRLPIDFMGFIFYPRSPRYAEGALDKLALEALPTNIQTVAVFVDEDVDKALGLLKKYDFKIAQLHGNESPDYCSAIKRAGYRVWKVLSVDENTDFDALFPFEDVVDAFLFDTKSPLHGGTGQRFDWNKLKEYKGKLPVFLSGGIGPEDVGVVLKVAKKHAFIDGIDLNSRFERAPGIKDVDKLHTFVEAVKSELV
jgi:phosphoribosylanthranilate isomerase